MCSTCHQPGTLIGPQASLTHRLPRCRVAGGDRTRRLPGQRGGPETTWCLRATRFAAGSGRPVRRTVRLWVSLHQTSPEIRPRHPYIVMLYQSLNQTWTPGMS